MNKPELTLITEENQDDDVAAFADRVNSLIKKSTQSWLEAAREVAYAKAKLSKSDFERFTTSIDLTTAKVDKLLVIGRRSKLYEQSVLDVISTLECWTTLYELTKLEDAQIDEIIALLRADPSRKLTRQLISNVAKKKPIEAKRLVVASLEFDALKLDALTPAKVRQIDNALAEIRSVIERLDSSGLLLNERKKVLSEMHDLVHAYPPQQDKIAA